LAIAFYFAITQGKEYIDEGRERYLDKVGGTGTESLDSTCRKVQYAIECCHLEANLTFYLKES